MVLFVGERLCVRVCGYVHRSVVVRACINECCCVCVCRMYMLCACVCVREFTKMTDVHQSLCPHDRMLASLCTFEHCCALSMLVLCVCVHVDVSVCVCVFVHVCTACVFKGRI